MDGAAAGPKWTETIVNLRGEKQKNRGKKSANRPGYEDTNGQIALPPKSSKRLDAWKKKMGID